MTKRTRLALTISILKRRYTTSLDCALQGGCLSLSQRVTRDIEPAFIVKRKWVTTKSGSRVLSYKIVRKLGLCSAK